MEKKPKKEKTVKQTRNKYRAIQYTLFGSQFLAILAPYITLGAINYEEYFVTEDGWKVGLGASLALALLGIAVWLVTKKKEDKTKTDGYISLCLGWFAVAFIFYLLGSIINDIAMIMFCGGVGLVGALGLNYSSNVFKQKANTYTEVMKEVGLEDLKNKVREEALKKAQKEKNIPTE